MGAFCPLVAGTAPRSRPFMRASLFVLLIWFCLSLQWAGLGSDDRCAHPA